MRPPRILIVDDDPGILEVLDARLDASGFQVFKADCASGAEKILKNHPIDLMISDVKMPRKSGMDLFMEIRDTQPHLPVIFLTAYGSIPDAVDAIKHGAVDYMSKPFDGRDLIKKIKKTLASAAKLPESIPPNAFRDNFFWGKSPAMTALYPMVKKVAAIRVNVLLLGESGVGKERIAEYIHKNSPRKNKACVIVDCGSTPAGILESELFGHMRGAFTHAVKDKEGLIETADRGTLFLDEIGNISHDMQCRLLRFLEDGKIRRVGAVAEIKVDARVIAATNADLGAAIENGTFRQDLYYRLKGITLTIPPLRERKKDIPELSNFFVGRYTRTQDIAPVRISKEAMAVLTSHAWPGNIRELKNTLEAGAILCQNNTIEPRDLQLEPCREKNHRLSRGPDEFSIEESEKNTIIRALTKTRGVQTKAAALLDISKRALHYKIKKHEVRPNDYK